MSSVIFDSSSLLALFHDFYSEVIHLKVTARSGTQISPPEQPPEEVKTDELATHPINLRLLSLLERHATEGGRRGGEYGASYFKDAQYIMAVLADETFLHMDWVGKDAWKSNLLELKLFGTNIAGDLFFKKIDKLLADRDPAAIEVSVLFLLALSFGFQGKFRGSDDRGQLDRYRRQLFTFIYQRNPDLLGESKRLFPEAYAYTLSMRIVKTLPYIRKWIWLLVAVVVTFLVLSFGLWTYLSSDLSRVIQEILSGG